MAGGNFIYGQDKVRPGLYINFEKSALDRIKTSERGITALPITCDWGKTKEFITIESENDVKEKLGHSINDAEVIYVREALKRSKQILVYRLNEGAKAKATWGTTNVATATAKYTGEKGNDIIIKVQTNSLDESKKDVKTYFNNKVVDEQTIANIEELINNDYVYFSGNGKIENTAGISLTGGTNGEIVNSDYMDFLTAVETQIFDVIAFPTEDESLKVSFTTFIKRLRDEEGKKVVGVVNNYNADYEGIINVTGGVELIDGTILNAKDCVAWTAGAAAGASMVDSLTYSKYEGAVDIHPRLTNAQFTNAIKNGEFVFQFDGKNAKVEQDINSLITYDESKNKYFSKNRTMRVLDAVNNDLMSAFNQNYIGKIDNDEDGQALLTSAVDGYFLTLQNAGAIKNYVPGKDFVIDKEMSVGDEVYARVNLQPVDSMEKFYFTIRVK